MSIEIGELIIQAQVEGDSPSARRGETGRLPGDFSRDEQAALIDEIVRRVVEKLRDQWRELP